MAAKDFVGRLINTYEAAHAREAAGDVKEHQDLNHHLVRIQEISLGLAKSARDREEAATARIRDLNDELLVARSAVAQTRDHADRSVAEAREQVKAAKAEAWAQIEAAQAEASAAQLEPKDSPIV
ncbi:MAG: hypothetical protein M0Z41_03395 [Peptococcaceae bacterium]|jgi:hypothetical protein|nr:hypothetical protein [Peptococcaceae bacterium]